MSDLTEALDRIYNWLQNHKISWFGEKLLSAYPHLKNIPLELLPIGLSDIEIDSIVSKLSIQLPEEIRELYRWRNGSRLNKYDYVCLFDIYRDFNGFAPWGFIPLQQSIKEYADKTFFDYENGLLKSSNLSQNNISTPRSLEIFRSIQDGCLTGYIYRDENTNSFPVAFLNFKGGDSDTVMRYASLTYMMITLAESYETAYYRRKDGYLLKKIDITFEIWQKYNSSFLIESVLAQVEGIENKILYLNMIEGEQLIRKIGEIIFLTRQTSDLRLINPLIKVFRLPPTNNKEQNENFDYFKAMSSMYLERCAPDIVIPLLIDALSDRYWLTRYWAVYRLGSFKNTSVVPNLLKLKEDEANEDIRYIIETTLEKL